MTHAWILSTWPWLVHKQALVLLLPFCGLRELFWCCLCAERIARSQSSVRMVFSLTFFPLVSTFLPLLLRYVRTVIFFILCIFQVQKLVVRKPGIKMQTKKMVCSGRRLGFETRVERSCGNPTYGDGQGVKLESQICHRSEESTWVLAETFFFFPRLKHF